MAKAEIGVDETSTVLAKIVGFGGVVPETVNQRVDRAPLIRAAGVGFMHQIEEPLHRRRRIEPVGKTARGSMIADCRWWMSSSPGETAVVKLRLPYFPKPRRWTDYQLSTLEVGDPSYSIETGFVYVVKAMLLRESSYTPSGRASMPFNHASTVSVASARPTTFTLKILGRAL